MSSTDRGFSTLELITALALLGAALWSSQAFYQRILDGQTTLMRTNQMQRAIANAKTEVQAWPIERITEASISQLPLDLVDAAESKWLVTISDIDAPLPCKQVSLAIQWRAREQTHTSASLTFWVRNREVERSNE